MMVLFRLLFSIFSILILSLTFVSGAYGEPIKTLAFAPAVNGWDIEIPDETLSWNDVKFYTVEIELTEPWPTNHPISISINIKEDRKSWFDKKIGEINARFDAGATVTSNFFYPRNIDGALAPVNTPALAYTDGFWLGCTKSGTIKGNGIKEHTGKSTLYLEAVAVTEFAGGFDDQPTDYVELVGSPQSLRHTIRCK
jgi:hypothetical protein